MTERFGIALKKHQIQEIVKAIQGNKAKFIERQSNRVTVWQIVLDSQIVNIVYDKDRKMVVTALYPENLNS